MKTLVIVISQFRSKLGKIHAQAAKFFFYSFSVHNQQNSLYLVLLTKKTNIFLGCTKIFVYLCTQITKAITLRQTKIKKKVEITK